MTLFRDRLLVEPSGVTHLMKFVPASRSGDGTAFVLPPCWSFPGMPVDSGDTRRRLRLRRKMKPIRPSSTVRVTCIGCLAIGGPDA